MANVCKGMKRTQMSRCNKSKVCEHMWLSEGEGNFLCLASGKIKQESKLYILLEEMFNFLESMSDLLCEGWFSLEYQRLGETLLTCKEKTFIELVEG